MIVIFYIEVITSLNKNKNMHKFTEVQAVVLTTPWGFSVGMHLPQLFIFPLQ